MGADPTEACASGHGTRPHTRQVLPGVQGMDAPVPQAVVDEGEQFAGYGDGDNVTAPPQSDTRLGTWPARRSYRPAALVRGPQYPLFASVQPRLVTRPWCTARSASRCLGVSPAHKHTRPHESDARRR